MRSLRAALFACTFLLSAVFTYAADDSIDEANRQMIFVDQMMRDLDAQKQQRELEQKAEMERRLRLKQKSKEARLASQFAGLSGKLSGLPEMPKFKGKLETPKPSEGEDAN